MYGLWQHLVAEEGAASEDHSDVWEEDSLHLHNIRSHCGWSEKPHPTLPLPLSSGDRHIGCFRHLSWESICLSLPIILFWESICLSLPIILLWESIWRSINNYHSSRTESAKIDLPIWSRNIIYTFTIACNCLLYVSSVDSSSCAACVRKRDQS